jgi:hypothetical protein
MGVDITGFGSVFDFAGKVIDKIFPNKDDAEKAKLELFKMQQAGELAELNASLQIAVAQNNTNIEEAKNASVWVSGWRPFIGWICGFALGYNYIFMPFFTYCAQWMFKAPAMLALDSGELTTILLGMLGLGAMRTFERVKKQEVCK